MKSGSRSNALLVELLIVVMFFMLSSTVLLQVFATSRNQSARAGWLNAALNVAQNTADRLYAAEDAEDAEAVLRDMGFEADGDVWRLSADGFDLTVSSQEAQEEAGVMRRHQVKATHDAEVLLELPVARYREVRQ